MSVQSKWGTGGPNCGCDWDGYRRDKLGGIPEAEQIAKQANIRQPLQSGVRCEHIGSVASNAGVVWVDCRNFAVDPNTSSYKAVGQSAVREALG